MKKGSESPLQQQANKRFLGQITGLETDEQTNEPEFNWQKLFNKIKNIF